MFFISFSLRNNYQPEESGVDMSSPVHPVAPPLLLPAVANRFELRCQSQATDAIVLQNLSLSSVSSCAATISPWKRDNFTNGSQTGSVLTWVSFKETQSQYFLGLNT